MIPMPLISHSLCTSEQGEGSSWEEDVWLHYNPVIFNGVCTSGCRWISAVYVMKVFEEEVENTVSTVIQSCLASVYVVPYGLTHF